MTLGTEIMHTVPDLVTHISLDGLSGGEGLVVVEGGGLTSAALVVLAGRLADSRRRRASKTVAAWASVASAVPATVASHARIGSFALAASMAEGELRRTGALAGSS
jgi:hypothetical protein